MRARNEMKRKCRNVDSEIYKQNFKTKPSIPVTQPRTGKNVTQKLAIDSVSFGIASTEQQYFTNNNFCTDQAIQSLRQKVIQKSPIDSVWFEMTSAEQHFLEKCSWLQCNDCLLSFSATTRFGVLHCLHWLICEHCYKKRE